MCLSCADACAAEKMDMRQCIRLAWTARTSARRRAKSRFAALANEQVIREMLELCARVCDACAAECESHEHEHCKLCAQMCRECAEDCRKAAESFGQERHPRNSISGMPASNVQKQVDPGSGPA